MADSVTDPDLAMDVDGPNNNESNVNGITNGITNGALTHMEPMVNDEPEARLLRFLYVGKEYADYQPGCWFVHNYFIVKNVPSIEELAGIPEKQLVPVQLIMKVSS
jgi:hypothetical protein